jgi:peptidyl-tRNA hydrolase, PTH1 family
MKLIVGLGNPGKKYQKTRHNIGFRVLDSLAKKHSEKFVKKDKFKAELIESAFNGTKTILLKPQTYMNLSGESLKKILKWRKIELENILVVYDDLDLELAKLRMRQKGSSGGHNGIQSLIDHLNTNEFQRLKIGISRPSKDRQAADYVLAPFDKEEERVLPEIIEDAVLRIEEFLQKS